MGDAMSEFSFDYNGAVAVVEEVRVEHPAFPHGAYWKRTTLDGVVLGTSLIRENLPERDRGNTRVNQSMYATDVTSSAKSLGIICPW